MRISPAIIERPRRRPKHSQRTLDRQSYRAVLCGLFGAHNCVSNAIIRMHACLCVRSCNSFHTMRTIGRIITGSVNWVTSIVFRSRLPDDLILFLPNNLCTLYCCYTTWKISETVTKLASLKGLGYSRDTQKLPNFDNSIPDSGKWNRFFFLLGFIEHVFEYIIRILYWHFDDKLAATGPIFGITFFKRIHTGEDGSRNSWYPEPNYKRDPIMAGRVSRIFSFHQFLQNGALLK